VDEGKCGTAAAFSGKRAKTIQYISPQFGSS